MLTKTLTSLAPSLFEAKKQAQNASYQALNKSGGDRYYLASPPLLHSFLQHNYINLCNADKLAIMSVIKLNLNDISRFSHQTAIFEPFSDSSNQAFFVILLQSSLGFRLLVHPLPTEKAQSALSDHEHRSYPFPASQLKD